MSNLREKLTGRSFEKTSSNGNETSGFRRIQMPEMKIGLGSNEGDLVALGKKYLEIVGLVLFVWILGKKRNLVRQMLIIECFSLGYFQFSVSWILLAVLIYLFRQRQRTQFKLRHKMLKEINDNEEQYIKARLDELPSWVGIFV